MVITWIYAAIIGIAVYAAYYFGKKKGKENARKEYLDESDEGDYYIPKFPQPEKNFFPCLDVYINDLKDSCHIENATLTKENGYLKFSFETESLWFYEKSRERIFEPINTIKPKSEYVFSIKFTENNKTYILHNCLVQSASFGDISNNAIVTFDYLEEN